MSNKTLNLDLAKDPLLPPIIYGRVGDTDMQTITVNITSRDIPVNLTGYIITFEGITNGRKTKVFDVDGVDLTEPTKGTFTYTFPSMAFAVSGNYEIAYFSITKSGKRDTTGEFKIIVIGNADIDAAEAETIITEYNKLVEELHEITDKYVSDSDAKFADLNQRITDLQSLITQYNSNVKNTADNAISTVNNTATSAIDTINEALTEFQAADFYNKAEADSRFASFSVVEDLVIEVGLKADEEDIVYNNRDQTIGGNKTFTGDTSFKNLKVSDTIEYPVITGSFDSSNVPGVKLEKDGNTVAMRLVATVGSAIAAGGNIGRIPTGFIPSVQWHFRAGTSTTSEPRVTIDPTGLMVAVDAIAAGTSFRDTLTYIL